MKRSGNTDNMPVFFIYIRRAGFFALQEFSPKIPVEQKCASRNDAYSRAVKLSLRDRARRGGCAARGVEVVASQPARTLRNFVFISVKQRTARILLKKEK